jgi:pSer/pThr/pTyr-binding forkhead associated (FHA) protein
LQHQWYRLQDDMTISVAKQNDIQLSSKFVLQKHCRLENQGDTCVLVDLKSHNGTHVNQRPIHVRILRCGDLATIVDVTVIFFEAEERSTVA